MWWRFTIYNLHSPTITGNSPIAIIAVILCFPDSLFLPTMPCVLSVTEYLGPFLKLPMPRHLRRRRRITLPLTFYCYSFPDPLNPHTPAHPLFSLLSRPNLSLSFFSGGQKRTTNSLKAGQKWPPPINNVAVSHSTYTIRVEKPIYPSP